MFSYILQPCRKHFSVKKKKNGRDDQSALNTIKNNVDLKMPDMFAYKKQGHPTRNVKENA